MVSIRVGGSRKGKRGERERKGVLGRTTYKFTLLKRFLYVSSVSTKTISLNLSASTASSSLIPPVSFRAKTKRITTCVPGTFSLNHVSLNNFRDLALLAWGAASTAIKKSTSSSPHVAECGNSGSGSGGGGGGFRSRCRLFTAAKSTPTCPALLLLLLLLTVAAPSSNELQLESRCTSKCKCLW